MLDSIFSYDITIILKLSCIGRKRYGFAICVTLKTSFHNISRKSVNYYMFINFNAWRYFAARCDVI